MAEQNSNKENFLDLVDLVNSNTKKSEEESLEIVKKFSIQIQNKLSNSLNEVSQIFASLEDVSHNQPIYLSKVPFISLCEHHLLPFFGTFDMAIFPETKIAGISKFSDLINHLSNDLTLQEKITKQAAEIIQNELNAQGVLVRVIAKHLCSDLMNPRSSISDVITTFSTGIYELDYSLRAEALTNFK